MGVLVLRYLPYLLLFALWIYAFVDCLGTPEEEVRGMPKVVWVLIILFFGTIVVGPLLWLLVGKRRGRIRPAAGLRPAPEPEALREPEPEGWIPPDDNPEFLRALHERIKGGGGQKADGE